MFQSFDILNNIVDLFNKPITFNEILLNFFFILIIGIILYIIYWDLLNKKAFKNSNCKANVIQNGAAGNSGYYYLNATDKNNNNLLNIKYDMNTKKPSLECGCVEGNIQNDITNIKIYDNKTNKSYSIDQKCFCEKTYDTSHVLYYTGEPFLVKYMYDNSTDVAIQDYTINKKVFPETTTAPIFPN